MDPTKKSVANLINELFSAKPAEKREAWIKAITKEEFDTVGDLTKASMEAWNSLDLPIAIKDTLRQVVASYKPLPVLVPTFKEDTRPITQIDVVVFDVSSSMNSKSFDPLNTRLGMAKILFHNLADKLIAHELPHTLGLVTFGHSLTFINFTRNFESFNDKLGNAEANEHSTRLFDAIKQAGEEIIQFRSKEKHHLHETECQARIFCLTDGEDNASTQPSWQVAKFLQENQIILDSIPLATENKLLQAMSVSTGGLCLSVKEEQQGVALFEREAILHASKRENFLKTPLPSITNSTSLERLFKTVNAVEDIKSTAPTALNSHVLKKEDIDKMSKLLDDTSSAQTSTNTAASSSVPGSANVKRIFKEYRSLQDTPLPGFKVFLSADDVSFWKVIMEGPPGTSYEGGRWMIYLQFPPIYPFKPPEFRFCTPIYHLNVNKDGKVCSDLLYDGFSPEVTVAKILQEVYNFLISPVPLRALDTVSANVYSDDKQKYWANALAHTKQHASTTEEEMKKMFNMND